MSFFYKIKRCKWNEKNKNLMTVFLTRVFMHVNVDLVHKYVLKDYDQLVSICIMIILTQSKTFRE